MQEHIIKALPENNGARLDLFLSQFCAKNNLGFSRTFIQKSIQDGKVSVNGSTQAKPHFKIRSDDEVRVILEEKIAKTLEAENISLDVVYEDADLAVINKPSGLVVHPAPGNYEHTLVNALLSHFKELSSVNPQRPGIVHRLDKDTSGLIVIAKNNFTHLSLIQQFAKHAIKRKYVAFVKGNVEFDENIIELPIGRHPLKRKSMSVSFGANTKYAKTYYRTLKRTKDFSILELEPFTGRTHQLRVHLAFIGHPVLGDNKYGKTDLFGRLALHAKTLGFTHPRTGKFLEFSSEMPEEFEKFLENKGIE